MKTREAQELRNDSHYAKKKEKEKEKERKQEGGREVLCVYG